MNNLFIEKNVSFPRKKYRCCLCGEEIEGRHVDVFSVRDREVWQGRIHQECHQQAEKMCAACNCHHEDCWGWVECWNNGKEQGDAK